MNTMEKRYTLVMDYDGTLHDSRAIYEAAFRKAMLDIEALGWIEHKEYTTEDIVCWVGYSAAEMWMRFHPELSEEQRKYAGKLIGSYMREALENGRARLYPGTEETMDVLKKQYNIIFLSNCDHSYMDTHRKVFNLDRWFDEFYCTGDYDYAQKDKVFADHIRREGVRYVAVGDRRKDIELAQNSDILSIGCLYGFGSREELDGANVLIKNICELENALAEL